MPISKQLTEVGWYPRPKPLAFGPPGARSMTRTSLNKEFGFIVEILSYLKKKRKKRMLYLDQKENF